MVDVASKLRVVVASCNVAVILRIIESGLLTASSSSALDFEEFKLFWEEDEKANPKAKTFLIEDNFLALSNSSSNEEINWGDFTTNSSNGVQRSRESHIEAAMII
jgi:hypothetical protein